MRSPESRPGHRPGRTFEEELNLRYLSPGAFTVLSSDVTGAPPDPPRAPQPYRVSPSVKRHRNQAFSILAEPVAAVRSRSPSPSSGRVSPFRGRGFNPAGSRHASPVPPSPPEDTRRFKQNPNKSEQRKSLIPQLQRRGSAVLSTEDSDSSPKFRRKSTTALRPQLSKSLNYIGPQNVAYKPPPNPRRAGGAPKNPLFSRLSPIAGSSPEPSSDKSTSSPSRIPMSRSTPPSRKPSPSREFSPGRVGSRAASRNSSRESSPGGRSQFSPTRIPLRNGVKVNNAKRTSSPDKAAKAPTKTQEIRNRMEQNKNRTSVSRRGSVSNRSVTNSGGKVSVGSVNNRSNKSSVSSTGTAKGGTKTVGKAGTKTGKSEAGASDTSTKPKKVSATKTPAAEGGDEAGRPTAKPRLTLKTLATSKATFSTAMKLAGSSAPGGRPGSRPGSKPGSKPGSLHGSPARKPSGIEAAMQRIGSSGKLNETATTVVTTTTSTVTTPLKIDAKIEEQPEEPPPKETPMYLDEDSQTLLKDHNLSKLSPAAATVVSLSNDGGGGGGGGGAASVAQAVPSVETVKTETSQIVHSSVVGNGADGKGSNNMSKLITPDDSFGAKVNNMSANERIKEARTMVASDVKPIKITVREKPNDVEVQSGNVRFPTNATNGVSSTLGLHNLEGGDVAYSTSHKSLIAAGASMTRGRGFYATGGREKNRDFSSFTSRFVR